MLFSNYILAQFNNNVNQSPNFFVEDIKKLPKDVKDYFNPVPINSLQQINGCCVYGYLREFDDEFGPAGSLYYIGEGRACRPTEKHNNVNTPNSNLIIIFTDNISKDTATEYEIILIKHYGRIDIHTGILLNKTSGVNNWGPFGKIYETIPCKFCGDKFAINSAIKLHELSCNKNPNKKVHELTGKTFTKVQCKYCNMVFSKGSGVLFHETYYCKNNPNKKTKPVKADYKLDICIFCSKELGSNVIKSHESMCDKNPSKIDSSLKGKTIPKETCQFCQQQFGYGPGITRHIKSCKDNPSRITRKYKK